AANHPARVRGIAALNILTQDTNCGLLGPFHPPRSACPDAVRLLGRLPIPLVLADSLLRISHFAEPSRIDPEIRQHPRELYRDPDQVRVLLSVAANLHAFAAFDPAASLEVPVLTRGARGTASCRSPPGSGWSPPPVRRSPCPPATWRCWNDPKGPTP
ncbi:hypothetical protein ACWEKM_45730, partial [Streptomyces sp. NPDC004752]